MISDAGTRPADTRRSAVPTLAPTTDSLQRNLPGGARLAESWAGPRRVVLSLDGNLRSGDRHAIVDQLTACILSGATHLTVDVRNVVGSDPAALDAVTQVRRFLVRSGGSIVMTGLASPTMLRGAA